MPELALTGGRTLDPATGALRPGAIAVVDGVIADVPATIPRSWEVWDVSGCVVSPGLIDLHTHVFDGQDLGLGIDAIAPPSGVTTVLDAGSAGAHLLGAFRRSLADLRNVDVVAFLNVSSIGTTSIMLAGELREPYVDLETAVNAALDNPDLVAGIKVRASGNVGGDFTDRALAIAREIADRVGKPLMVHLGPAPSSVTRILASLRAGDIITHAFTGWEGNTIVRDGAVIPEALAARERGVLFDVGHGMSGIGYDVLRTAIAAGFAPDTVSTDLHAYSTTQAVDLPTVMGRAVAAGMSIEDVLLATTRTPARALGLARGELRTGAVADITVLRITDGPARTATDAFGGTLTSTTTFSPELTIRRGRVVHTRS